MKRLTAFLMLLAAATTPVRAAPPELVVYAAGSTVGALGAMLDRYTAETGQPVRMVNGPAGLLSKRIEAGEHADLFVSANMAHAQRLTREGKAGPTTLFARNALCVTARPDVHLTSANMLDRMLDPAVGIGTSTPRADPGGDYAWALFDRAEAMRPGAAAILKAKAKQLVGGGTAPAGVPKGADAARYFLANRTVDMFIGYCSSHDAHPVPGLDKVRVPEALAVPVDYGMVALRNPDIGMSEASRRLAGFLVAPKAQAILPTYGFEASSSSPRR
jgi:ABC-type molybdate transport system substrate-binding protein